MKSALSFRNRNKEICQGKGTFSYASVNCRKDPSSLLVYNPSVQYSTVLSSAIPWMDLR